MDEGANPGARDDVADHVAATLRRKFGDDALSVAVRQLALAEDESRVAWMAIAQRLLV